MSHISVSTCPSELDAGQWEDLTRRAYVNVFLHPAALSAVRASGFADLRILLAWDESVTPRKLAGVWALQRESFASFMPLLVAPAYNYAFLSCPMVDPALSNEVIEAFFEAIVREPDLPKVLRLNCLDAGNDSYFAIIKALGINTRKSLTLAKRDRPFAVKDAAAKRSGSTRKKLRQNWNRISALGMVEIINDRAPARVEEAFEIFLAMEAASWKGTRRTALLSNAKDAAFARRLISDLAHAQSASVAVMTLNGRAIACQVLLYCGAMAYTWKTAFDSDFASYSPGVVLVDRVTEQLLSSGSVEAIESCSPEGGFMAQLWVGRRSTVDLLVQLDDKPSLAFASAALADSAWRHAKGFRNAVRSWAQPVRLGS